MNARRISLYDDNRILREIIQDIFVSRNDYVICSMYADCENIVQRIVEDQPDIVIMDIDIPPTNGIDATILIRKNFSDLPVLVQTVFDDEDKIFKAILAGANGYIIKEKLNDNLFLSLDQLCNGGTPLSPGVAKKVFELFRMLSKETIGELPKKDYKLTNREREVLELLVSGLSYKMISEKMFVAYETAHSHIKSIYRKLHVASMSEAVSKALREKII